MHYSQAIKLTLGQQLQLNGKVEQIIRTKSCSGEDIPAFIGLKLEGIEEILYMRVDMPEISDPEDFSLGTF